PGRLRPASGAARDDQRIVPLDAAGQPAAAAWRANTSADANLHAEPHANYDEYADQYIGAREHANQYAGRHAGANTCAGLRAAHADLGVTARQLPAHDREE